VVTLQLKIMQIKLVKAGDTIGYGASWKAMRDSRIAILGAGYRDGIPRRLSSSLTSAPAFGFVAGARAPIVGRVSMDVMAVDVTDIPDAQVRSMVEIFGPNIPLDEAAAAAGTISWEVLTHLGNRYCRRYIGGESKD
ncbi:MAG: alanine racemase, partial [Alphaproteobacteria bacterium]|nr:alanine racemase [Alphaproteobacteria bacterium]